MNLQINKENVFMRMVSGDKTEFLDEVYPLDTFLDMKITYRYMQKEEDGDFTSFPLTNDRMVASGIKREELFELAKKNTDTLFDTKLYRLIDIVEQLVSRNSPEELFGSDEPLNDKELYVLTNSVRTFGAVQILFGEKLGRLAERMNSNFYILPSSIHELIIVPDKMDYTPDCLMNIVREVNQTSLTETEYMADSVYYYDHRTGNVKVVA